MLFSHNENINYVKLQNKMQHDKYCCHYLQNNLIVAKLVSILKVSFIYLDTVFFIKTGTGSLSLVTDCFVQHGTTSNQ